MHLPTKWCSQQKLSSEAQRRFSSDGFCVIDPCVGPDVLKAFKSECEALSCSVDLDDTDCVVYLWAPQALLDNHPARKEGKKQKRKRKKSKRRRPFCNDEVYGVHRMRSFGSCLRAGSHDRKVVLPAEFT